MRQVKSESERIHKDETVSEYNIPGTVPKREYKGTRANSDDNTKIGMMTIQEWCECNAVDMCECVCKNIIEVS